MAEYTRCALLTFTFWGLIACLHVGLSILNAKSCYQLFSVILHWTYCFLLHFWWPLLLVIISSKKIILANHITSDFLKAVFHKYFLVHSWIPWPIWSLWTKDLNWIYIKRSEDVQVVFLNALCMCIFHLTRVMQHTLTTKLFLRISCLLTFWYTLYITKKYNYNYIRKTLSWLALTQTNTF